MHRIFLQTSKGGQVFRCCGFLLYELYVKHSSKIPSVRNKGHSVCKGWALQNISDPWEGVWTARAELENCSGLFCYVLCGRATCGQTWSALMLGMSKLDSLCKGWAITPPKITTTLLRELPLGSQGTRKSRLIKNSPSKIMPLHSWHISSWPSEALVSHGVHCCLGCQSWYKRVERSCW